MSIITKYQIVANVRHMTVSVLAFFETICAHFKLQGLVPIHASRRREVLISASIHSV
jgi:hypothetical protein